MSVRPTRRAAALLAGALTLFAVGTNVQAGWVLAFAAILTGLLIVGVTVPIRALAGVEVRRRGPRTATAGQLVPVTMTITNTGRNVRALIGVYDRFCGDGAAFVDLLRPGETREFANRRDDAKRGVLAGGTATLVSGAPFGVVRARRTVEIGTPIVVYPRVHAVAHTRSLSLGSWRSAAPMGDASSVRDYRRGDPLRHIHWRSAARRGQLVVREFDTEKRADVTVVADVPPDARTADAIASAACSVALSFMASGSGVDLVSGREQLPARTTESVLEWGARLCPHDDRVSYELRSPGVFVGTAGAADRVRAEPGTLVVLIGGDAEAERLRAGGAAVAVVDADEVEAWCAAGCPAT